MYKPQQYYCTSCDQYYNTSRVDGQCLVCLKDKLHRLSNPTPGETASLSKGPVKPNHNERQQYNPSNYYGNLPPRQAQRDNRFGQQHTPMSQNDNIPKSQPYIANRDNQNLSVPTIGGRSSSQAHSHAINQRLISQASNQSNSQQNAMMGSRNSSQIPKERSAAKHNVKDKLVTNFGLYNQGGQLNCFLNSALQSLWNLSPVAFSMKFYVPEQLEVIKKSSTNPLIFAIKDFFRDIIHEKVSALSNPKFDASLIRKEMFKFYYPGKMFELNKKADASEAFLFLLNILHFDKVKDKSDLKEVNEFGQTVISPKQLDRECDQSCFIHEHFQLNLKQEKQCRCGKAFPQEENSPNNFSFYVQLESENGFIAYCNQLLGDDLQKPKVTRSLSQARYGQTVSQSCLQKIEGKFQELVRLVYQHPEQICISQGQCKLQSSTTKYTIDGPFPTLLTFNMNYNDAQAITPSDLLKIYTSIPNIMKISSLFDLKSSKVQDQEYQFKGMICYLGAHYLSFFRQVDSDLEYDPSITNTDYQGQFKPNQWTLYDDLIVREYPDWSKVVSTCIEGLVRPTLLFFQKVHPQIAKYQKPQLRNIQQVSTNSQGSLIMSSLELSIMERVAREQSQKIRELDRFSQISKTEVEQQQKLLEFFQQQKAAKQQSNGVSLPNTYQILSNKPQTSKESLEERKNFITPQGPESPKLQSIASQQQIEVHLDQNQIKKDIKECIKTIKSTYLKHKIFLYRCHQCKSWIDLSTSACHACRSMNFYYEEHEKVDPQFLDEAHRYLRQLAHADIRDKILRPKMSDRIKELLKQQQLVDDTDKDEQEMIVVHEQFKQKKVDEQIGNLKSSVTEMNAETINTNRNFENQKEIHKAPIITPSGYTEQEQPYRANSFVIVETQPTIMLTGSEQINNLNFDPKQLKKMIKDEEEKSLSDRSTNSTKNIPQIQEQEKFNTKNQIDNGTAGSKLLNQQDKNMPVENNYFSNADIQEQQAILASHKGKAAADDETDPEELEDEDQEIHNPNQHQVHHEKKKTFKQLKMDLSGVQRNRNSFNEFGKSGSQQDTDRLAISDLRAPEEDCSFKCPGNFRPCGTIVKKSTKCWKCQFDIQYFEGDLKDILITSDRIERPKIEDSHISDISGRNAFDQVISSDSFQRKVNQIKSNPQIIKKLEVAKEKLRQQQNFEEEPPTFRENEWECEKCTFINTFSYSDKTSYICQQCASPNFAIKTIIMEKAISQYKVLCPVCLNETYDSLTKTCFKCINESVLRERKAEEQKELLRSSIHDRKPEEFNVPFNMKSSKYSKEQEEPLSRDQVDEYLQNSSRIKKSSTIIKKQSINFNQQASNGKEKSELKLQNQSKGNYVECPCCHKEFYLQDQSRCLYCYFPDISKQHIDPLPQQRNAIVKRDPVLKASDPYQDMKFSQSFQMKQTPPVQPKYQKQPKLREQDFHFEDNLQQQKLAEKPKQRGQSAAPLRNKEAIKQKDAPKKSVQCQLCKSLVDYEPIMDKKYSTAKCKCGKVNRVENYKDY